LPILTTPQVLETTHTELNGFDYVTTLLTQLHTLAFAFYFNQLGEAPGGKTWKGKFYDLIFCTQSSHASKFIGLNEIDYDAKLAAMKDTKDYKAWRKTNQLLVTNRNRLLEMYHLVRLSIFNQFKLTCGSLDPLCSWILSGMSQYTAVANLLRS
jgi:hypothetical protein